MKAAEAEGHHAAELSALDLAASQEAQLLGGLSVEALESLALSINGTIESRNFLTDEFEARLRDRINATYPRENSLGQEVSVSLAFARLAPRTAWVQTASPVGVRSFLELPTFMGAEAGADVEVVSANGVRSSTFVAFGGAAPPPALVPLSLASRLAQETASGGRVERFVGQAAQAFIQSDRETLFNLNVSRDLVLLGLRLEMASQFLTSGNASLDAILAERAAAVRGYTAADFVADPPAMFFENYSAPPVGRPVLLDGPASELLLSIVNFTDADLAVFPSWSLFDGQELGGNTWGSLTVEAWGSLSFGVRAEGPTGSFEVADIRVPVSFNARAAKADLAPALFVSPPAVASALVRTNDFEAGLPYRRALLTAGVVPAANGTFNDNETVRAVIRSTIAGERRPLLPPVEDAPAFLRAFAATHEDHANPLFRLTADVSLDGSRGTLSLDGTPWQSAVVQAGAARFFSLASGLHDVSFAVEQGPDLFVGGGRFDLGGSGWTADLRLERQAVAAFVSPALKSDARSVLDETAGAALLREAGLLAGLGNPPANASAGALRAYCDGALARLEVLLGSGVFTISQQVRAKQAAGALKIMSSLLDAADAAYQGRTGSNQSVGALASSVAILSFTRNPAELVYVTAAATKVASVSLEEGGLLVRFFKDDRAVRDMLFRLDELTLVAEALGGALSLAADFVTIQHEFDEGDLVGVSLAAAKTELHLADLTVAVAKGVYGLAGAATPALKVAFRTAGLAVGAATLVLEVALLYHEYQGNLSAMGQALLHPADLAGMVTLPGLVGSAVATFGGLIALSAGSSVQFGPIGLAAALFVLAGLLVINARDVATAIFGTLPERAAQNISENLDPAARALFEAAVAANAADPRGLFILARSAAARASALGLEAAVAAGESERNATQAASLEWTGRSRAYGLLAAGALNLRHAAGAAVEQLDDFASGDFVNDPGRLSEGYANIRDALGHEYPYEGSVNVTMASAGGLVPQTRFEWRRLLDAPSMEAVSNFAFHFSMTASNSIPSGQFSLWADKFQTSAAQLKSALARFNEAQSLLAGPAAG